jgi:hypothetical protein
VSGDMIKYTYVNSENVKTLQTAITVCSKIFVESGGTTKTLIHYIS